MQKGQAISVEIPITLQGEVRHFELRLPRKGVRIKGVETGTKFGIVSQQVTIPTLFTDSLVFTPARLMGEIRMQELGRAGTFFSTHVREEESHMGFGDFSINPSFKPFIWTRNRMREMESIDVECRTGVITGFYRDFFGQQLGLNKPYKVKVQVWYEPLTSEQL